MGKPRDEFSDRQKAEIFARDRAICCFSGLNLWGLDYGAAPHVGDQIDHVVAAMHGGAATADNGQCSSWIYNQLKGARGGLVLFRDGRPLADFYSLFGTVPDHIAAHLQRFRALHFTDWYFNKAVNSVWHAAAPKDLERRDGTPVTRDRGYWCRAAHARLIQWRRLVETERPGDLHSRGLVLPELSVDQRLLLSLVNIDNVEAIIRVAGELEPYCTAAWKACTALAPVEDAHQTLEILARLDTDPYVPPRVRAALRHNAKVLFGVDPDAVLGGVVREVAMTTKPGPTLEASVPEVGAQATAPRPAVPTDTTLRREVFTIGQDALESPARLGELVARLGVVAILDTRAPAPSHGPWCRQELEPILGGRLIVPEPNVALGSVIADLPEGRVLVFGAAKAPGAAPARLALGGWCFSLTSPPRL